MKVRNGLKKLQENSQEKEIQEPAREWEADVTYPNATLQPPETKVVSFTVAYHFLGY